MENLQPMCCLCNWKKGDGVFPTSQNIKKYNTKTYNETPIIKINYTNSDIKIGDIIFKKTGKRRKIMREVGEVKEFCLNPHTGREAVKVINKRESYYHLNSIYKIKE